jgi:hypothetical protein
MQLPKITVLFRSTFIPTGATYIGIHDTTDLSFGNEGFTDPYIGNGVKLIELAKQSGNRRSLWNVQAIRVGTRKECEEQLRRMLDNLDYTNPKVLNAVGSWPKGVPQSAEHKEKRSQAMSVASIGNTNSVGRRDGGIDIEMPAGQKLKWFHSPDNTEQKMIVCDENDKPIKEQYNGWILGKMHRNPHVQRRLDEIKQEKKTEEESED